MFGIGNRDKSGKKKEKASEERKFVSELSYNVRNPLNTICGITEIAKKSVANGNDKDTLMSYLDILGDAATELQQTIDHFFECFESGNYAALSGESQDDVDFGILNKLRILVVEDSSVSQLIAKELLESHGSIVTLCDSGREAIDLFTGSITGTYDVIMMDINMPGMDGYEATDMIRSSAHPQARAVPIIAMTAEALPGDIEKAMQTGMNGHISKPINAEKIVAAIKGVL
ncbi:MAG: response regulator [Lachnospiraceae bacterium]|nr:response regulator [Lachnospiraceae bacterium]